MSNKKGRMTVARQIANYAYDNELTAVMDKMRAYEDHLREMSDAEFAEAVREYAARLAEDFPAR